MIPSRNLLVFTCFLLLILTCFYCQSNDQNTSIEKGSVLAKAYCQGCHLFPDPELLDQSTWEAYVLPRMGYFLGIYQDTLERNTLLEAGLGGQIVNRANVFPSAPTIKPADWEAIKAYYLAMAPKALPEPPLPALAPDSSLFLTKYPPYQLSPPSTTMVKFGLDGQSIYIGDANTKAFYQFDQELNMVNIAQVRESVVHQLETPEALLLTVMGSFSPTDHPSGFLLALDKSKQRPPNILIKGLQRPLHTSTADLDQDGNPDFVIAEFGKWTGGLSWWRIDQNGQYRKTFLSERAGAIKSVVGDFNADQLPDVLALFGQGQEGFYVYYNQGNGQFKEKPLIALPATYGSSSFDWLDYDQDGDMDILYTAGDNADYPPVLKPYHGIYLYENQGDFSFEEAFFYPLHGAYSAIAADFDRDGDRDIAAISFFPDFENRSTESFVFLEEQGQFDFQASTIYGANSGRWIVMDTGDPDQDGDLDIVIGGLTLEVIPKLGFVDRWIEQGIPFVFLENQTL